MSTKNTRSSGTSTPFRTREEVTIRAPWLQSIAIAGLAGIVSPIIGILACWWCCVPFTRKYM